MRVSDIYAGKIATNSTVTVKGWIRTRRDSKGGFSFLQVHDGSCFQPIQAIVQEKLPNYQTEILKLTAGCSVIVTGVLTTSQGKGQPFEIQAAEVEVLGLVDDPDTYPISPKHHTLEYLREVAHLRPRTNTFGALARIRHCAAYAVHRFFNEQGFYWLPSPIITASDCEGAGQMFRVSALNLMNLPRKENQAIDFNQDFFGKETFLTVSGQLNAEAYALALSKVYTFGPTFRAENSNTARHLAEFWMIEPEIAFADLHADADLAEKMLKEIFKSVLQECSDDMQFFAERYEKTAIQRLENILASDFKRIDYTDAVKAIEKSGKKFEFPLQWGMDLQTEHERYLAETLFQKPVIVMNYPKVVKAFYMRLNDDDKTVAAMDVLAPGIGEIIGGSQREDRLEILDQRMKDFQVNPEDYQWYRDLRRYGSVPHAGFGLGFERLLAYITGLSNVRDISPFPRTPGNARF